MKTNLIKKWGVSVIAVLMGGIIVFAALAGFQTATIRAVEESVHSTMVETARTAALTLRNELQGCQDLLRLQAKMLGGMDAPTDDEVLALLREFAQDRRFAQLTFVDADGTVFSSVSGVGTLASPESFPVLKSDETRVSGLRVDADGRQSVDVGTPVYQNGRRIGRLSATFDAAIWQELYSTNALEGDAALCLFTGDGTVIATFSKRPLPVKPGDSVFVFEGGPGTKLIRGSAQEYRQAAQNGQPGWLKYELDGKEICLYHEPMGLNDWVISITATDGAILRQSQSIQRMGALLTMGIVAVVLTVAVIVMVQRVREQRRLDAMKNTYSVAIRKTNDLFYEADIDSDQLVDYSESQDKAIWKESPKNYSDALSQIANVCSPEYRQQYLDTFLPRNIKIKIKEGISYINFEYKVRPDEHTVRWLSATFVPVQDGESRTTKLICMENDITEQKLRQERLRHSATVDGLTGLYNRITTETMIDDFLTGPGAGGHHAFLIVDIDHFKQVNDTLGHAKGDEVLTDFGGALQRIFRQNDIVGRIGGDEFVVLLKECGDLNKIRAKAAEIGNSFRRRQFQEEDPEQQVQTSASVGIALYSEHGTTFEELYKSADAALYTSKNDGRDRATVYTGEEVSE